MCQGYNPKSTPQQSGKGLFGVPSQQNGINPGQRTYAQGYTTTGKDTLQHLGALLSAYYRWEQVFCYLLGQILPLFGPFPNGKEVGPIQEI